MEHLNMNTVGGSQINLDELYQICPSCFTEVADNQTGGVKRVVDFNKLRSLLGDNAEDSAPESYDFNWVGKRAAQRDAAASINKTLRPCPEESVDWETTKNLYIEGDNLEVLKLLQNSYMGKVKMIYIDPPYNTGNDFVYHDDYAMSSKEYELSSNTDEFGNKYFKNTEAASKGRIHSDWCSMIYSRLSVARTLLSVDGVIFISIDYHEFNSLKTICNEIFGESNYVGEIVWQTATDNNPTQISLEHEYVLCYAKDLNSQPKWSVESEKAKRINAKYHELKNIYGDDLPNIRKSLKKWINDNETDLKGATHYSYVDDKGVYYPGNSSNTKPGGYMFDIVHPITHKICSKPAYGYRWTESTFLSAAKQGDVEWGDDETTIPKIKKRIETVTESLKSYYYEDSRYWTKYLNKMFGRRVFENPKSCNLIAHLMEFCTNDDSIVLDFFSGSASTAHSVFIQNVKDDKTRHFILVQIPEATDNKSEAYKAGFKTISEIGKERIKRVGNIIREENPGKNIDTGFRVFKCDSSNMKDVYFSPTEYSQSQLTGLEDNIKEDRTDLDLLFDCMLRWGVELTLPVSSIKEANCTIYNVNAGDLVACFDGKITDVVIDKIADMNPLRVVFRDSNFDEASQKMNLFELFKQKCNWTEQEVINNVKVI